MGFLSVRSISVFRQKETFYASFFLSDDGVARVESGVEVADLLSTLKHNIHDAEVVIPDMLAPTFSPIP